MLEIRMEQVRCYTLQRANTKDADQIVCDKFIDAYNAI